MGIMGIGTDGSNRMAQTHSFPVVMVPQAEGGYFVQCPTLPGCYSQGDAVEQCLANIREAIEIAIEDIFEP
jgi:predicted RNase H-like HicB family nuclease